MRALSVAVSLVVLLTTQVSLHGGVITFDELPLGANSFYNGGPSTNTAGWSSGGAFFNNSYDSRFGGFWNGWSYSNSSNNTTPGFGNQYSAYTGSGFGGSGNYAIAYPSSYIDLPTNSVVNSARFTNTTYAALSMVNGDSFAKKFGGTTGNDADFFRLTIDGKSSLGGLGSTTGSVDFFLADYRFSNNSLDYIVNDWRLVDLSALSGARSLSFSLSSSDMGQFGMNTPSYFALDNLTVTAVPEPSSLAFLGCCTALAYVYRSRGVRSLRRHF